jgi:MFS family permease
LEDLRRSSSHSIVRWEILTYLGIANFLSLYCFYLPGALYTEGAVPLVAPQFIDLVKVGSFMSFVLGLAARPIGALFFGLTGDSEGSKASLLRSGYLLCVVTLLMGLIPSFEQMGLVTPILNIILRILQGFAIGGTYSSIALLAYDAAPAGEKSRFTCFVQVTAPAGYLGTLAVVLVLKILCGDADFADWGWPFSFLASVPLFYFLRKIQQTPCFFAEKPSFPNKSAVFKSVLEYFTRRKPGTGAFFFYILPTTGIVGLTTFMGTVYQLYFFQSVLHMDPMLAKFILAMSSLLYLPTYFLWGFFSDFYDKRKIIFGGLLVSTIATIPFYFLFEKLADHLKDQGSLTGGYTWLMILVVGALSSIVIVAYSPLIAFLGEVLPKEHRNTLFATSYHFGFGLLGCVSQVAGSYLIATNFSSYGALYVTTGFCVVGLLMIMGFYYYSQASQSKGMKAN